ncbi:MAG: glycosyltransferase [Planctomycetia bacterium]|jgi:cellulose synthase/poly-beta-1,6-N-acetylglucosamine synthase-like glycosyltransferase
MDVNNKPNLPTEEKPDLPSVESPSFDATINEVNELLHEIEGSANSRKTSDRERPVVQSSDLDELGSVAREIRRSQWQLGRRSISSRQWSRQAAIVIASLAAVLYLVFRALYTLNLVHPFAAVFSVILLVAEAYGLFHLSLYFYQVWRLVEPPIQDAKTDRTVDVFVTTFNEEVDLLRNTLRACVEMEYPHTTYVLDDGHREEVRELAESLGVKYIAREDRKHAKAGNVNNALRQTRGDFVIILDADHVPHMHFIMRMIGYFNDPEVGFVQAPHTTYNLDNFLGHWSAKSRVYWEDVRIFFEAVQLGKNRYGCACFCGSAAMFRRKALEDIDLFATETITEDLHTGMRINAAGWKSFAVNEELVVGLAPEDSETSAKQRLRWGEGNLSVMAYDNPLTMKGLRLSGRINYLASILNWTYGPARLIMYLVPIVMLLTAVAPVANLSLAYIAVVVFYLVSIWAAVKIVSNKCGNLLRIELAMMSAFNVHIHAIWRALFKRRSQKFVVTAKRRAQNSSVLRRMWPQVTIVSLGFVAISWAATRVLSTPWPL